MIFYDKVLVISNYFCWWKITNIEDEGFITWISDSLLMLMLPPDCFYVGQTGGESRASSPGTVERG